MSQCRLIVITPKSKKNFARQANSPSACSFGQWLPNFLIPCTFFADITDAADLQMNSSPVEVFLGYQRFESNWFTYFGYFIQLVCKFLIEMVVFRSFPTRKTVFGSQLYNTKSYQRMSLVSTFMETFVHKKSLLQTPRDP